MGKTNLKILEFEDGTTKKDKPYTRFKTSEGWMSCFDVEITKTLKDVDVNQTITVEVQESPNGKFKNIRKIYDETPEDVIETPEDVIETVKPGVKPVSNNQDSIRAGVATRYAVDLCIAGKIEGEDIKITAAKMLKIMNDLS